MPRLVFVEPPYRLFLDPLFHMLDTIRAENPDRTIAVVVPELAGGRWYDYFLHNQRSTALKAALLLPRQSADRAGQRALAFNEVEQIGEHDREPSGTHGRDEMIGSMRKPYTRESFVGERATPGTP